MGSKKKLPFAVVPVCHPVCIWYSSDFSEDNDKEAKRTGDRVPQSRAILLFRLGK